MKEYVVDASALVALAADAGAAGEWAAETISEATLFAPDLVLYEAANILRRHRLAGLLDETNASLAHDDLLDLPVHLESYCGLAERVWQWRDNVTVYDAAYIALAKLRDIPLVTLDVKLGDATGPRCRILTP